MKIKSFIDNNLFNVMSQDLYMEQALKKGFDIFKIIGVKLHAVFQAMENIKHVNFIMLGHSEEFTDSNYGTISHRMKLTGKMTREYVDPEGRFDAVLFMRQTFDHETKHCQKEFVTAYDGQYPAKAHYGMFDELYMPNDMAIIIEKADNYFNNYNKAS